MPAAEPIALVVDGGEDLTPGAWQARSDGVARALLARGVGCGDRVALLFGPSRWADFAAAYVGVLKAGGVAVLLSPGATASGLVRALDHSGAVGLLCDRELAPEVGDRWVADPREIEAHGATQPLVVHGADVALAELLYPPAPLERSRPAARSHADVVAVNPALAGRVVVHAWSPGSLAGQHVLGLMLAERPPSVATLACFDPDRMAALVARHQAETVGLTPALAAALVASGAPRRHDLGSVTRLVLSPPATAELCDRLRRTFPGAEITAVAGAPPVRAATHPPVAASQAPMVWHEQFVPGSFNLPCFARRYRGPLDGAAMAWALSELVRRHEPLRTNFEIAAGEARQVVNAAVPVDLPLLDLARLPGRERDREVARLLADATSRPFDLATESLFQPQLVRLGADDHLLVVRLHHTVFDDWSVDVFRRELSALYSAGLSGAPSPLLDLPVTFRDFGERQRAALEGEVGVAQRAWWRKELDGAPLAVQLPLGRGPSSPRTAPVRLELPPSLAQQLRRLARELRATPYMTVLAGFAVVVSRLTGLDDLVLASVVAHRNRTELESLIGCFTKKVPVRIRLHGDPTFAEVVARTRAALLGALSHQDVPFEAALHEGLGKTAAEHGVVPHVAVVFQAETPRQVKVALPGLTSEPYEAPAEVRTERHFSAGPATAWGDGLYLDTFLILSLAEVDESMTLIARGAFDPHAVVGLLEGFRGLLDQVVADPGRPVSQLPVAGACGAAPTDDVVEVRGFRASRSRLEAALRCCPNVADVAVRVGADGRVVAYVVPPGRARPTLAQLRHTIWDQLPGGLWPARVVLVESVEGEAGLEAEAGLEDEAGLEGEAGCDRLATLLAAVWSECRGRPAVPGESYWQDFSFLEALAEVRQAGFRITDDQVARCRTPEMLAAASRLSNRGG